MPLKPLAALLISAALALAGCADLPKNVERPVSTALPSPAGTPLGELVDAQRAAAGGRHASGFVLLSGPQAAYGSRLALVDAAQKTLDLQYYAIHADASSQRLLRAVAAAARRGVRVRVLLDDFHSAGRDALVMRLAFVPNVEMRMFNPIAGARGSAIGRMLGALGDFARVQQRMHNKLFIADNALGVTGGRNLGDAYFGQADAGNFVDLDVLAAGPVVQDLSRSFDSYWNNERAYPVQSLVTREELDALRQGFEAADAAQHHPEDHTAASQPPQEQAQADRRARVWDQQPMDLAQARLTWAPAAVLADRPAKIPPPTEPADAGSDAADAHADTVVDGLLQLMGQAQRDLLIVSPYFVPGPDMKQAFAAARARGVRVRVLTNSLASNDAPIAHAGYARHRPELLALGVELYEMRSELPSRVNGLGATGSTGSSRAMLHSKLIVMDGRLLAVGSMNLDMRSQHQNTELALLIRSGALSRQAAAQIDDALRDAAWRVEADGDGRLVWRAPQASGLPDATTEPDASLPLRLMLQLLGPLAPDHLL
ncbi:MAG: phospholipase D family protein [Acidovorax sp.]|uniref:phospholipase D family protein n=1 Tax=Acidovorax sp. TaxID=1872122 RepID=UPI0039E522EE